MSPPRYHSMSANQNLYHPLDTETETQLKRNLNQKESELKQTKEMLEKQILNFLDIFHQTIL